MITQYHLRRSCYICVDYRFCIFLDVDSNRYLATATRELDRIGPWLSGWPHGGACTNSTAIPDDIADVASRFESDGLLTRSIDHGKPFAPQNIVVPDNSIFTRQARSPRWRAVLHAAAAIHSISWAHRQVASNSLASIITSIAALRGQDDAPATAQSTGLNEIVGAFLDLQPLYSRPNSCLRESLALLHLLSRSRIFPSLVLGVICEPFQAHCWLQLPSLLINDTAAHVSNYKPIFLI